MTIREVLNNVNETQPNTYSTALKLQWLTALDFFVIKSIYQYYEGDLPSIPTYDEDTDLDTELLIPDSYALEVYIPYLKAQIDLNNNEITRYNNSSQVYNTALENYRIDYSKEHEHKQSGMIYR